MVEQDNEDIFSQLYADILEEEQFYNINPFLAHYTSLDAFENILLNDEVWFSNPLFMNDKEELKFGILNGSQKFKDSDVIKDALGSPERYDIFVSAFDHYVNEYDEKYLLDTYVFSLSAHDVEDYDGKLSMWRGYGQDGNGVAIVLDSSKFGVETDSPLIISKVNYGSVDDRMEWFERTAAVTAEIISKNDFPDKNVYQIAWTLFDRLKLFALFTKHSGFKEEGEWRIVYMSDKDQKNKLTSMLHYYNGSRGVEPKLKFKVVPNNGITSSDFSFNKIISRIILGPTTKSTLAFRSVERMLDIIGKPELKDRLYSSSIPFRK